ncbi:MAG TPA: carboxypeptidase-like regulatory domain-containing protein, partial [Longimicrobiaceae bacterium]|nr:carboxypeptidase-like regulatory domain-containing protein [Longimicrobiaceae bacterium]
MKQLPSSKRLCPSVRGVVKLLIIIGIGSVSPVSAQIVEGKLLDYETGQPISGASIALLDRNGNTVRGTLSASDGTFRIEAPSTGQYRLRAERIGYRTTITP